MPFSHLRFSRVHIALAAVVVSFALAAEGCSGTPQGVGGGVPSGSAAIIAAESPTATPTTVATSAPATPPPATPNPATARPTLSKPSAPARITFPAGPASGQPGQIATLSAHFTPGFLCAIAVHYQSRTSTAQGLGSKRTDGSGNVSWSWKIGTNTTRGQWGITVTCGSVTGQTYINVT
jgi:hypothetical protein